MSRATYEVKSLPIRLLVAAEREFALSGEKARVSDILRLAGAGNAAAVNYHFRSRDGLFAACRVFREGPLNNFRGRLLERLKKESGDSSPSLAECFFMLVAPSVAVITSLLPESYYGRFVFKCDTYNRDRLEERRGEIWAEPAIELVAETLSQLELVVEKPLLDMRLNLYERNIALGLAQAEVLLMKRLAEGGAVGEVLAHAPDLIEEISRHSLYSFAQHKVGDIPDLSLCKQLYLEELQAFGPFVYRTPDRMRL